ncbi:myosin light chain kinase 2, skeletal/cardiac muscle-like isoform X1 [Denticeps clupeoides]|uniref:myosin light chain kinase 2, skeletal/cardiac muscle-like isoform X1 n=1 Tax=Denticeps clupeoides TaxID=299321 RepID=UPI0010A4F234|nr:myosin light chain kinase 2, skeletal/cardiac muscle-like isoform X1 [Denticeps clupeoides]
MKPATPAYPWRPASAAAPSPAASSTTEAKLNILENKLDELLRQGGGCLMCRTCERHAKQQEAVGTMLSAQAQVLDSLHRKVLDIQKALDGLGPDLNRKQMTTAEKIPFPAGIQQRRKSLPMRTLMDEVYVHLDADRGQHHVLAPPARTADLGTAGLFGRNGASIDEEKKDTLMNQPKPNQEGFSLDPKPKAPLFTKVVPPLEKSCNSGKEGPPRTDQKLRPQSPAPKPVLTPKGAAPLVKTCPPRVAAQIRTPAGSDAERSKNPPATCTQVNENKTASPASPAQPKVAGMSVPLSPADGSLRHAHSCPEALQRLQSSGPKHEPVPKVTPPLVKASTPGALVPAGGIQIRVSPAVEPKATKSTAASPPRVTQKVIDDIPAQPAPFPHRFVSLKSSPLFDSYSIHTKEVLGGGRFGKVHKCTENATGHRLAAKIINARSAKDKEMALNEMQVMNQLSHVNILQLYDAFEVKTQVVLILEYVEGGELFERIVDESSQLTEVDAMVFVRQICEGVQYMHQMYVLHLDLKPENILCVNRTGHQVKIIDFGLARRYKPREKLRVSFGTPEFLAPEVVNFDFVSFPTDMWTLGVVTYMLLSGLSPFLGDDDSQTLNNVLSVNWYFDEDAFEHVSAEAKDFVSNLLIRERSGRLSAAQCLKHPWLNNVSEKAKSCNVVLKSQVLLKKYMARRMWKKNYIAIAAANRFKKIASSGSLTSLGI